MLAKNRLGICVVLEEPLSVQRGASVSSSLRRCVERQTDPVAVKYLIWTLGVLVNMHPSADVTARHILMSVRPIASVSQWPQLESVAHLLVKVIPIEMGSVIRMIWSVI
jgi:hypothetical protein